MPKPFDAAVKDLLAQYPADWIKQLGLPQPQRVEVIEGDVSAVTAQADKVLLVYTPAPCLLHLEIQASRDPGLGVRTLQYNTLLHARHGLPVYSAVVLLRRAADASEMTGRVAYSAWPEQPWQGQSHLEFTYHVVRLWQMPVDSLLHGGLGTLPLAPLANVKPGALPGVISHIKQRLTQETPPPMAEHLWASIYILLGLRLRPEAAAQLLQGVRGMKESSTYQAILQEGRAEGLEQGLEQ